MEKKIGQLIKERVKSQNVNVTEFAKNIGMERTNVYDIYERESIDTGLLKKNWTRIALRFLSRFVGA